MLRKHQNTNCQSEKIKKKSLSRIEETGISDLTEHCHKFS
jgi:hypothetical protein